MEVVTVRVLEDNFSYLIVDRLANVAAAVDPIEPKKVLAVAQSMGVAVTTVLTTHSHWDHAGGNNEFKQLQPQVEIVGGQGDGAQGVEREVGQGDKLSIGSGVEISVLYTPCHTAGHVCYVARDVTDEAKPMACFTGDTMFVAGCGNFNSGTPQQMYTALYDRIGALPPDTQVYVGHEYTVKNLRFAITVEPSNVDIRARLEWAIKVTRAGGSTVPSTIADEHRTNPFLRCGHPTVQEYAGVGSNAVHVLAEVRKRKSAWRG